MLKGGKPLGGRCGRLKLPRFPGLLLHDCQASILRDIDVYARIVVIGSQVFNNVLTICIFFIFKVGRFIQPYFQYL